MAPQCFDIIFTEFCLESRNRKSFVANFSIHNSYFMLCFKHKGVILGKAELFSNISGVSCLLPLSPSSLCDLAADQPSVSVKAPSAASWLQICSGGCGLVGMHPQTLNLSNSNSNSLSSQFKRALLAWETYIYICQS